MGEVTALGLATAQRWWEQSVAVTCPVSTQRSSPTCSLSASLFFLTFLSSLHPPVHPNSVPRSARIPSTMSSSSRLTTQLTPWKNPHHDSEDRFHSTIAQCLQPSCRSTPPPHSAGMYFPSPQLGLRSLGFGPSSAELTVPPHSVSRTQRPCFISGSARPGVWCWGNKTKQPLPLFFPVQQSQLWTPDTRSLTVAPKSIPRALVPTISDPTQVSEFSPVPTWAHHRPATFRPSRTIGRSALSAPTPSVSPSASSGLFRAL